MNAPRIDPTAIVDPAAELHDGVVIGSYCTVGPRVTLKPVSYTHLTLPTICSV